MSASVKSLSLAVSPFKTAMLQLLEEVRGQVERGETVSLIILPVNTNREWSTMSAGDMSSLEKAGILAVALDTYVQQCHSA